MVDIKKQKKDIKWEVDWQKEVQRLSFILDKKETDLTKHKSKKIKEFLDGEKVISGLKTTLDTKQKKLNQEKSNLVVASQSLKREKDHFETGGKKAGWKTTYDNFKTTWRTNGWNAINQTLYPSSYVDNLYSIEGVSNYKITEDQATKILARVIYEIGRMDRTDWVKNHGLTDTPAEPTKTQFEDLFNQIVVCSKEIETINSRGTSAEGVVVIDGKSVDIGKWEDRAKTWDLPFTYSVEQGIDATTGVNATNPIVSRYVKANSLSALGLMNDLHQFVSVALTDEIIAKFDATKHPNITKTETNFDIYQAGDVYDDETLEAYGINLTDKLTTSLYRSNKYNATTKKWVTTDKHPISIQNGLKDWTKLFKSVFENKENREKFQKGLIYKTQVGGINRNVDNPNVLLFEDLRSQTGTETTFTDGSSNYRLFENLDGLERLEEDLMLTEDEVKANILKLKEEVDAEKKVITDKRTASKQIRSEVVKVLKETLDAKITSLREYELGKGFAGQKRTRIQLHNIKTLILEIRYLENEGDATYACDWELNNTANHCRGWIGVIDASCRIGGTLRGALDDAHKTVVVGKNADGTNIMGFPTTVGTLEKFLTDNWGALDECYLTEYFRELAWDNGLNEQSAIDKVKSNTGLVVLGLGLEANDRLQAFYDAYVRKEELGWLNDFDQKAFDAIKKELNMGDTLNTWQTKLLTIDSSLNATIINDAWKVSWEATAFKTSDSVKTLFEEVKGKTDFVAKVKAKDNTITDLKSILVKTPQEVITHIAQYTYDNLADTDSDEKKKAKTQMKRRLAKALGKTNESEITEVEITTGLYKVRTGELAIDTTKFYKADLTEYTTESPEHEDAPKKFFRMDNPWMWTTCVALPLVVVGLVTYFWTNIMKWWNGSEMYEEDGEKVED